MTDDSFVVTVIGAIVTTILSLVILRTVKYFDKKQDSKTEEVKQAAKESAELGRKQAQHIAEELTLKNEERNRTHISQNAMIAEELRKENLERDENVAKNIANNAERIRQEQMIQAQKISDELKTATAKIARELDIKNDENSDNILNNINDVEKRLSYMVESIKASAILTNGSVAKIRTDIMELQDDVDHIYDKINHEELQTDPQKKIDRERKRKIRKREISNNSLLSVPSSTREATNSSRSINMSTTDSDYEP